jgi:CRP-like cAMP-binding protein
MNAIFSDLAPETVAQLFHRASFQTFERGDYIFRRGDPGTYLFGVVEGSVRMCASSPDGKSAVLNLIGAGQTFGEIAVLDGLDRTTDAIANSDCEIWGIARRDLIPLVRTEPALAAKFIDLLCARLRWTSEHLEEVILHGLEARLAHIVVKFAEPNLRMGGSLVVNMTQQSVSEMVGISRERANKIISAWAERGWVLVKNRTLVLLDAQALGNIATRS